MILLGKLIVDPAQIADGTTHCTFKFELLRRIVLNLKGMLCIRKAVHMTVHHTQFAAKLDALEAGSHLCKRPFQNILGLLVSPKSSVCVSKFAKNQMPVTGGIGKVFDRFAQVECAVECS